MNNPPSRFRNLTILIFNESSPSIDVYTKKFLGELVQRFLLDIQELVSTRCNPLGFPPETAAIRDSEWKVWELPQGLPIPLANPQLLCNLDLMDENVKTDNGPVPTAFLDYAALILQAEEGCFPFFLLSGLESYHEASLWREVFAFTEQYFGWERGKIKAFVSIDNYSAIFQTHEMLYALGPYAAGLKFAEEEYLASLPAPVTPGPFMDAYRVLIAQTCVIRNALCLGENVPATASGLIITAKDLKPD